MPSLDHLNQQPVRVEPQFFQLEGIVETFEPNYAFRHSTTDLPLDGEAIVNSWSQHPEHTTGPLTGFSFPSDMPPSFANYGQYRLPEGYQVGIQPLRLCYF